MKYTQPNQFHILTPFSRKENKDVLIKHLEPFDIQWHPIIHEDIEFGRDWIHPVKVVLPSFVVDYCYFKLNQFLYSIPVGPDDYYLFLCDDDFYEEDFFKKLRGYLDNPYNLKPPAIIVSMKRGKPEAQVWHSTTTLVADRRNMCINKIGLEQIILRGDIMDRVRFMNWSGADGILAEMLVEDDEVVYLPEIYVYFNYLEKGRW